MHCNRRHVIDANDIMKQAHTCRRDAAIMLVMSCIVTGAGDGGGSLGAVAMNLSIRADKASK
jgi:hypothetical protein